MNTKKRKLLSAALLVGLWMPMTSLAQSVNAVYKSTPIEKVFSDLREKTKYEFVYQKQILQGVKPVTCSLKDLELRNALDTLLKDTGLEYEIVDQTVIIRRKKQIPTNTQKINGMPDHIHIAVSTNADMSPSVYMRKVKSSSSKWIIDNKMFPGFQGWGKSYFCATFSYRDLDNVRNYISNQKIHHHKMSLNEELESFFKAAGRT